MAGTGAQSSIIAPRSAVTWVSVVLRYQYDPVGRLTGLCYPDGSGAGIGSFDPLALGMAPRDSTHIEARILYHCSLDEQGNVSFNDVTTRTQPRTGENIVVFERLPPCDSCRGVMRSGAQLGNSVTYVWRNRIYPKNYGIFALQMLRLEKTAVTDAGLVHLSTLTALDELVLERTAVGDAGLRYLRDLPSLRVLNLVRTRCTGSTLA